MYRSIITKTNIFQGVRRAGGVSQKCHYQTGSIPDLTKVINFCN